MGGLKLLATTEQTESTQNA